MVRQPRAQFLALGVAERRRCSVVQDAVKQAIGQLQTLVRGQLFKLVDRHRPGHIAFVRPGRTDAARLASEGPEVTQAGATNAIAMPLKRAFSHHRGAWPDDIRYFEHAIAWSS